MWKRACTLIGPGDAWPVNSSVVEDAWTTHCRSGGTSCWRRLPDALR